MKALALTLGHNSSTVLIEDGQIVAGYEEERFSGNKADSNFPIRSLVKLNELFHIPPDVTTCVSHWFLDGEVPKSPNKYWDLRILRSMFPKTEILGLYPNLYTHHDAHADSAAVFAGSTFPTPYHTFVVDGFGTEGECYSVYETSHQGTRKLLYRVNGFSQSIGLLYQYATAYCGMKMHQHEYKMLAYEVHILEVLKDQESLTRLNEYIDNFKILLHYAKVEKSLDQLNRVKESTFEFLDKMRSVVIKGLSLFHDDRTNRIIISYIVQRIAENTVKRLFDMFRPTNLLVVGGVFYNVKINRILNDLTPGKFCAMPLAGDQGAGLGVYQYYFRDLKWPGHLFWGRRTLSDDFSAPGIIVNNNPYQMLRRDLHREGMVNLVRGDMEFGPRALCNTSTLALPRRDIAEWINKMNGRTNEMPFALVMTEEQANNLFANVSKIHRSLEYMIIALRYDHIYTTGLAGGLHYYPIQGEFTCRPQITRDPMMVKLLEEFGPLINTSFNVHGQPIVYENDQIEYAHIYQNKIYPITTVVQTEEDV